MNKKDYPQVNEHFHQRLCAVLENLPKEKELEKMKRVNVKKTVLIAAAIAVVMSATAFAGGRMITGYIGSSSSIPQYTAIPDEKTMQKDFGFGFRAVEAFSNGYRFQDAVKGKQKRMGEGDEVIEQNRQFICEYSNGTKKISLFVDAGTPYEGNELSPIPGKTKIGEYRGTEIYETSYRNKVVPADYQLTDEDEKAEESGELIFSYGSDEVELHQVASVMWRMNDLNCSLLMMDNDIEQSELLTMVQEIIDNQ